MARFGNTTMTDITSTSVCTVVTIVVTASSPSRGLTGTRSYNWDVGTINFLGSYKDLLMLML